VLAILTRAPEGPRSRAVRPCVARHHARCGGGRYSAREHRAEDVANHRRGHAPRLRRLLSAREGSFDLSSEPGSRRIAAMARRVQCKDHGDAGAAFICAHVTMTGDPRGFFWTDSEEPCGWCADCERARTAEGEWNERSEAALGKVNVLHGVLRSTSIDSLPAMNAHHAGETTARFLAAPRAGSPG
jgi:hypothetical protein